MPSQTTIIISRSQSDTLEGVGLGMMGYRVDLAVTQAANIDPKIFIMQREVLSVGSQSVNDETPFEDTFYSVATPSQIESVPEAPTSDVMFYRVDSVSLVFENLQDLQRGVQAITDLVELLRACNDRVINLIETSIMAFPPESCARFWGISVSSNIDDSTLLGGRSDLVYSRALDVLIPNGGSAARYVYFAYPATLGEVTSVTINDVARDVTLVSRTVETVPGADVAYKVYRTTAPLSLSSFLLQTS